MKEVIRGNDEILEPGDEPAVGSTPMVDSLAKKAPRWFDWGSNDTPNDGGTGGKKLHPATELSNRSRRGVPDSYGPGSFTTDEDNTELSERLDRETLSELKRRGGLGGTRVG